jgi:hypothetical protein
LSLPYSPNAWPWRYRLGALLVHYAIRTLMHQAALDAEVDADRLSFTRSLDDPAGGR